MGHTRGRHRLGPLARALTEPSTRHPAPGAAQSHALRESALLHRRPGEDATRAASTTWGNLGLWPLEHPHGPPTSATPQRPGCQETAPYAQACEALARAVGEAAGIAPGARVLSLACGAGDELRLWRHHFGAAQAVGVETASQWARPPDVLQGSADALHLIPALQGRAFDHVLCVDAAYHFAPQSGFLRAAWQALRPGGTLAYTQLVWEGPRGRGPSARTEARTGAWAGAWSRHWIRTCARLCGVNLEVLQPLAAHLQQLQALGFEPLPPERLDNAVLGGFVHFVREQEEHLGWATWHRAWWRVAVTARLIPPCRAAGLGYVLLAARKPLLPVGASNTPAAAAVGAATG